MFYEIAVEPGILSPPPVLTVDVISFPDVTACGYPELTL